MMLSTIKAEFRKLLSIRSTYVILGICFLIEVLFSFYLNGMRLTEAGLSNPSALADQVTTTANFIVTLIALVAIFTVSHEYRYNTVLYTLTSARGRLQVFFAKIAVMTVFSLLASLLFAFVAMGLTLLGTKVVGNDLVGQSIPYAEVLGRTLFFSWAFTILALLATFIIRSQIGAIAFIFFFPGTIEALLGFLLKDNSVYLPFIAVTNVLLGTENIMKSVIIGLSYIGVVGIVSAVLFRQRDAN